MIQTKQQITDTQQKHILVTRPGPSGPALCQLIAAKGFSAIHFPTIAFAPPKNQAAFKQALLTIAEQEWVVFVSKQAVSATLAMMHSLHLSMPKKIKIAAVGGSTATELERAGFQNVCYPKDTDWNTEALLALSPFQVIEGKKIAVIRGEGGREQLDKMLKQRGAIVSSVIAYQRILPKIDVNPYLDAILSGSIQAIICLSFESIVNLQTLLTVENQASNQLQLLKKIPLIVASARIKRLAGDLGFQTICVAHNGSDEAVLEGLNLFLRNHHD